MTRSGFLVVFLAILVGSACHESSSPTVPDSSLAGTYSLTTTRSCAGAPEPDIVTRQTVIVTQMGDQISFMLGVDTGGVRGTVSGNTIALSWQQGLLICPAALTGNGTVAGNSISGSVSGVVNASGCDCNGSTLTITFGMMKQ